MKKAPNTHEASCASLRPPPRPTDRITATGPVAAKMKERALSPIIANMPPAEAKKLTEALAARFAEVKKVAAAAQAAAGPLPAAPRAAGQAAAPPAKAG